MQCTLRDHLFEYINKIKTDNNLYIVKKKYKDLQYRIQVYKCIAKNINLFSYHLMFLDLLIFQYHFPF
jgi:hypothetical protein